MPRRDAATVRLAGSPALLPKKWSSGDLFIGDLEAPPPATGTGAGRAPRAATPPRLPPLSRAAASLPCHFLFLSHSNYCPPFPSSFLLDGRG